MKKFFTGIVCLAAIVATSVVLLPAAAVKIAVRLSKPRHKAKKDSPRVVADPSSSRLLTEAHKIQG
jgi:hypothetical protein